MEIVLIVALLIVGFILIIKGGDFFVDAASWFAKITGIPSFIIGATIVSLATTLPEIIVSATAAFQGSVDLAVGNTIGSFNANLGLIMGLSVTFVPVTMKRKGFLTKFLFMIVSILIFTSFAATGGFKLWHVTVLLVVGILFFIESVRSAYESKDDENEEETFDKEKEKKEKLGLNIVKFIIGAAGIFIGAQLLINNATKLATFLDISPRVIAITTLAIGTSLPELTTAIIAIRKKETSMSIGNIIGANILNLTLAIPISGYIYGGVLPVEITPSLIDALVGLTLIVVACIPTLYRQKFSKWQGILLISIYVIYLGVTILI